MDFTGGEVKLYKNDNYYCSIKLLTVQEYLWEEYNEIISLLYMNTKDRLEFAKKVFPHIVVKTTRDFFIALFQFYDKDKKYFNVFSKLFIGIEKFKFGFGVKEENVEDEDIEVLINYFLYFNAFKEELEKPERELSPMEKRQKEMEERIRKIKQNAANWSKDENSNMKKSNKEKGFSYGKAIAAILKEFSSLTIKDIMNLPIKWFFSLSKIAFGYSYHMVEVVAMGNGLIKTMTHYTEERKNE